MKYDFDFADWFRRQFGYRQVPTVERSLTLRKRYESLTWEADQAKAAWLREVRGLDILSAALKGHTAAGHPQPNKPKTKRNKGGEARARALSPERRSEIAKKAARTRWSKKR